MYKCLTHCMIPGVIHQHLAEPTPNHQPLWLLCVPMNPNSTKVPSLQPPQDLLVAAIPQTLIFTGQNMSSWGMNTLTTSSWDWVHLAPTKSRLALQQPLVVASQFMLSGVAPSRATRSGLLQRGGRLTLACHNKTVSGTGVIVR